MVNVQSFGGTIKKSLSNNKLEAMLLKGSTQPREGKIEVRDKRERETEREM
jgi:hypothetical protein